MTTQVLLDEVLNAGASADRGAVGDYANLVASELAHSNIGENGEDLGTNMAWQHVGGVVAVTESEGDRYRPGALPVALEKMALRSAWRDVLHRIEPVELPNHRSPVGSAERRMLQWAAIQADDVDCLPNEVRRVRSQVMFEPVRPRHLLASYAGNNYVQGGALPASFRALRCVEPAADIRVTVHRWGRAPQVPYWAPAWHAARSFPPAAALAVACAGDQ